MKKKMWFTMVVSVIASLMLAACAAPAPVPAPIVEAATAVPATEAPAATEAAAATEAPAATEVPPKEIIEVTVWRGTKSVSGLSELNYGETKIGKLQTEKDGVNFIVHYVTGDVDTDFNLKVADGDWEDVIVLGRDEVKVPALLENKAVLPLNKYFDDAANYPNLAAIPKDVLEYWRQLDGNIYQVPVAWHDEGAPYFWAAAGVYVNPSIAKSVKYDYADIKTTKQFKEYLVAIKDAGIKNEFGLEIVPLSGSEKLGGIPTLLSAFGIDVAKSGYMKVGGKWTHWRDNPQYKEALFFLNDLNRAGVMDKEYASTTDSQLVEKLLSKRVGVYIGAAWPFWATVTAGVTAVTELELINFPHPEGVTKNGTLGVKNPYGSGAVMLSSQTKYADQIMKWFDYYAERGKYRDWEGLNGPFDVTWEWQASRGGEPHFVLKDEEVMAAKKAGDYNKIEALGWQVLSFVPAPYKYDLNEYIMDNEGLAWIFKMNSFNGTEANRYYVPLRGIDMAKPPTDGAIALNTAALKDVDLQFQALLVNATSDALFESAWKDYMSQLEIKGKWSSVDAEYQSLYKDIP